MTATDLFHHMLRERIAPALRDAGFTGTGLEYRLREAEPDHALLGFQRSASDTEDRCRFTVNLRTVPYEEHEALRRLRPALGSRLSANRVGPVGRHTRIGRLLGHPHDHWWTVTDERDAALVADDVVTLVLRHAVPALWAGLADPDTLPGPAVEPVPDCLDPACLLPAAAPRSASQEVSPGDLHHTLVMEVGERRSTPFLVFRDEVQDRETRLVMDAAWRLEQPLFGSSRVSYGAMGDVRVMPSADSSLPTHPLALLGELSLCVVDSAVTAPDGSLKLAFEGGTPRETLLTVAGGPHPLTVDRPWYFDGWTGIR
uniref:DUF4304 domain-containing protein n=1 Tax=Streptomyces sp. NBC_00049 TaxID=2903617 RepID=A0AAU2JJA8_9ACTN